MLDSLDGELGFLVKEELCRGWYAQAVNAKARQLRIAAANARLEHAHIEGVGQHVASIDAFSFIDWERRHPGITRQKDWWKSLLRDNPECRVQSSSSKTQVSFAGLDSTKPETGNLKPECNVAAPSPAPAVAERSTPFHSGFRSQASALSSL
jgi:hypothetical protein